MTIAVVFLHVASILTLGILFVYSFTRMHVKAGRELGLLLAALFVWALGSFAEILAFSLPVKLFWRNITQFGVFFTAAFSLQFVLRYADIRGRFSSAVLAFSVAYASVAPVLIFTDSRHGLIRKAVYMSSADRFASVVTDVTGLGMVLISVNMMFELVSLALLLVYMFSVRSSQRSQVALVFSGMAYVFLFAGLKIFGGPEFLLDVPISTSFAIGCIPIIVGIHRHSLLALGPVAMAKIYDLIDEGILILDEEDGISDMNEAARRMLQDFYSGRAFSAAEERAQVLKLLERVRIIDGESLLEPGADRSGEERCFSLQYFPFRNMGSGSLIVLRDVSRQRRREEVLERRASLDDLTGVLNRSGFVKAVEEADTEDLFLVLFDIDDFKLLNDTSGHLAGDEALVRLCSSVKAVLRDDDLLGRLGGDEFMAAVRASSDAEAMTLAERLCSAASAALPSGAAFPVFISLGIAPFRGRGWIDTYRQADQALYRAKSRGKNRASF